MYYIHSDHLDSPRSITNTAGQEVWRWDNTDPFGNNIANENPANLGAFTFNLRFPGQYFDRETGLHYNVNRDYNPATGRYVQSDPIGLQGGINTFGYVGGNPLGWSDPKGLEARKAWTPESEKRAVASVCGMSNKDIYTKYTPTATRRSKSADGDTWKFRNMETYTVYGKTDIDWALTLADMSNGSKVPPSVLYVVGKMVWMLQDDPMSNAMDHWREFNSVAEKNAVRMADDLVSGRRGFADMFPSTTSPQYPLPEPDINIGGDGFLVSP